MYKLASTTRHVYMHTTFLSAKNLPELLVMSMKPANAKALLHRASRRLEKGELECKKIYHDLLVDFDVYVLEINHVNLSKLLPGVKHAWQLLLPDSFNRLPVLQECLPIYQALQPCLDRINYE
ncbi:MAG: DUF4262 domain-containing protein [Trueperaceae bacterium]